MSNKEKIGADFNKKKNNKILIVSSGVFSTPPKEGDAIAKLVFELGKSLSKNLKITIFDVWTEGYKEKDKINENLEIVRTKIPTKFKGKSRHIVFGLCSSVYAIRNGFKVVHCNTQWPLFFNWLFMRKTIFTSHYYWGKDQRLKGEKLATKLSNFPIAISNHIREEMLKLNTNTKLINNGVNVKIYKPFYKSNKTSILFVGKLWKLKGVDTLIKAFNLLQRKTEYENLTLDIVGPFTSQFDNQDNSFYLSLTRYIKDNRIKNIYFHGPQEEEGLIKFYNDAKVFVLPSKNEGMSLALLEAMSCGIPSIANDFPGVRSYFPEESGLLTFKYNDYEDLAEKIKFILELDKKEYQKLSRKVRKYIEDHYSWDIIASQYIDKVYSKLL